MSERNGDRARFQKDRKKKLRQRQRMRAVTKPLHAAPPAPLASSDTTDVASPAIQK